MVLQTSTMLALTTKWSGMRVIIFRVTHAAHIVLLTHPRKSSSFLNELSDFSPKSILSVPTFVPGDSYDNATPEDTSVLTYIYIQYDPQVDSSRDKSITVRL